MHWLQLQHRSRNKKEGHPPIIHLDRLVNLRTIKAMEKGIDYIEYLVDGLPLSTHFAIKYGWEKNFIETENKCPIGWFGYLPSDVVTLKRLLNLPVVQRDVEQIVGSERSSEETAQGIHSLLIQFQDEWIMFYCCPICGDPLCGGMAGGIRETAEHFIWYFGTAEPFDEFTFEKGPYRNVFLPLLQEIEAEIADANR
jgi:hypothetical protein